MSSLQKYLVLSIGYQDLIGIFGGNSLERIIKEIKEYNLYAILESCAKISATLLNRGLVNPLGQAELLAGIFPDQSQRIRFFDKARAIAAGSPWAIFNQQSVLTLAKIALLNCPISGGKSIDKSNLEQLGYWLLIINDDCFAVENSIVNLPSKAHERVRLMKALSRYQFFHSSERLAYKIGRYRWIVEYFRAQKPHGVDIDKLFYESTNGVSLKDYMIICSALLVKWVTITTKEKVDLTNDWITCPDVYFKNTKLGKDSIDRVLEMISMLPQEFNSSYKLSIVKILDKNDQFHYNFMPLLWKPLIWYQDKKCFICPSTEYLFDKVTEGIYRTIETYLWNNKLSKERDLLSISWGNAFEYYIKESLTESFNEDFYPSPHDNKSKKEMIDGIIDSNNFVFIIETKYTNWTYKTLVTGDMESSNSSLTQLFKDKGLAQISNCIRKYWSGEWKLPVSTKNKQFIPLLIVSQDMPQDIYNRRMYEIIAEKAKTIIFDKNVLPFIILDAEEIELLEVIAKNQSVKEAIQILSEYARIYAKKNEIGYVPGAMSFKTFLYDKGYQKKETPFNNQRLLTYFEEVMNDTCLKAFGKKIKDQKLHH